MVVIILHKERTDSLFINYKTMTENPFERLVVDDSQDADSNVLANMLEPFVVFIRSTKAMEFTQNFHELGNDSKILLLLAASKARAKIFKTEEKMKPKEIIKTQIMPEGSVKTTLKKLLKKGKIKTDGAGYFIPGYLISALSRKITSQPKS